MAVLKWVIMQGQGAEDGDYAVCIKTGLLLSYVQNWRLSVENLMYAESFSNSGKLCTSSYTIHHQRLVQLWLL